MPDNTSKFVHPLMRISNIGSFDPEEWLERWMRETAEDHPNADELIGLLFRVPSFNSQERFIPLCLDITDGYQMSDYQFKLPNEKEGRSFVDPGKLRLKIAQKAFWAICEGVFKDKRERHALDPSWASLVMQKRIFKKILWFILDEERRGNRDVNLPRHLNKNDSLFHQEHIFRQFVINLIKFAWKFDGLHERSFSTEDAATCEMFREARPDFIRILHQIGELNILKQIAPIDTHYKKLNIIERRILRELSLGYSSADDSGKDVWRMIEDEVGQGNEAAEFLWCYLPKLKALRREKTARRKGAREQRKAREEEEPKRLKHERAKADERLSAFSTKK